MQVSVLYLGMLKEIAGREKETMELDADSRLSDLFDQLEQRMPRLGAFRGSLALAVNYEYADPSAVLQDNDEVALLPPVSGGKTSGEPPTADLELQLISEHASIVRDPIDPAPILARIKRPESGAVAIFDGIVRNQSRGRRTLYLEYTAYERMALAQMEQIARQALARFEVNDLRLVHRVGTLQIGETSVYIAVASAHRAAAFDACRWLIDTLKTTVPIWKKEFFEDGAVWADGEPFPPDVRGAGQGASKPPEPCSK